MKQLYYLSAPDRRDRFDLLFDALDVVAVFHDITQIKSLVAFLTKEKAVAAQDYLLFDLAAADYSQEHILSAVQSLRRFSVARLLFLAPPGGESEILFGKLAAFRVSDLMTDGPEAEQALRSCLTGEEGFDGRLSAVGTGLAAQARQTVSPLRIPPGLTLEAAVAGSMARAGTTTQAFALYHYLKSLGFTPIVRDDTGALPALLADFYQEETVQRDGYAEVNGIPVSSGPVEGFNASILDMGVLTQQNAAMFRSCGVGILVGGGKPWELPALARAAALAEDADPAVFLSFATEEERKVLSGHLPNAFCTPYHPDIWRAGSPSVYQKALLPRLRRVCGQTG